MLNIRRMKTNKETNVYKTQLRILPTSGDCVLNGTYGYILRMKTTKQTNFYIAQVCHCLEANSAVYKFMSSILNKLLQLINNFNGSCYSLYIEFKTKEPIFID